ncbi:MAG: phosphomethylpyrimidine synthase ThiC [Lachnospira eligens]
MIPANKNHKCLDPNGIGNKLRTKINVNLGTSRDCVDLDMELDKVNNAVKMGAEAIMSFFFRRYTEVQKKADIRMSGKLEQFLYMMQLYIIIRHLRILLRRVADVVEMHAKDGVDFMTIHCGINKATAKKFRADKNL